MGRQRNRRRRSNARREPVAADAAAAAAANDARRVDRVEGEFDVAASRHWIEGLADVVRVTHGGPAGALRTALACDVGPRSNTLFLPPEMRTLQPRSLRWLEALAGRAELRLSVDRRQNRISPLIEQRNGEAPLIARGIAGLLRQTGLPGSLASLSLPHRLLADSPLIDLPRLIAMTGHAIPHAKQIVVPPNEQLVAVLHDDTRPIRGYACVLDTRAGPTVLSHFDSPTLRCIGYSAGRQYVVHVLLAGGTLRAPSLWTTPETLARTEPRFRLFQGRRPEYDFGLVYTTLYYDMQRHRPQPWWLAGQQERLPTPILSATG